jgi:hypothetical protein
LNFMTVPTDADIERINEALKGWKQGDLVLTSQLPFACYALASLPLSPAAQQTPPEQESGLLLVESIEPGFVVVTQTCDIVRSCRDRPYVEFVPLVPAAPEIIEEARRLRRAAIAFHPEAARHGLVADLDRAMTIEKALLVSLPRQAGLAPREAIVTFAAALANKRARFAFPDDFVETCLRFTKRVKDKASKQSPEGRHLDALEEIRVLAEPDWAAGSVDLTFWLVKRGDPPSPNWPHWANQWAKLIDTSGRYKTATMRVTTLDDMTARDYQTSHHLDFDQLSVPARR